MPASQLFTSRSIDRHSIGISRSASDSIIQAYSSLGVGNLVSSSTVKTIAAAHSRTVSLAPVADQLKLFYQALGL